jgi:hypothetical protein
MNRGNRVLLVFNAFAAVALLFAGWNLLRQNSTNPNARRTGPAQPFLDLADASKSVQILNFYASPGTIVEGEAAILCYGVANAKKVRIDPPVDRVWPALTRCVEVSPVSDTRYTLFAEDEQGQQATESFMVTVSPDPTRSPRIVYFHKDREEVDNGKHISTLCFRTWNAELVRIDPPAFPEWKLLQGCFYVAPEKTTTYTLTVVGRRGQKVEKQLIVEVPPPAP